MDLQRLPKGFTEAKRTGKPLLVVLRCVPCLACAGIDSAVLLQETELAPLLDKFVCVRVINANALDLSLFQFDYDLSFSTLFFNGDGTVYGRYGSWKHQRDPQDKTTANYKAALEAALAIHHGYPANKASLAGKQGIATPYKTPIEIPGIAGKYELDLNWTGKVVQSCVHCHQIGEAFRETFRKSKQPMPSEMVYSWPGPEVLGLTLAPDSIAHVQAVSSGSVADKAGLRAGDDLLSLQGQPLISVADLSWVLNRAPETGTLKAVVAESGSSITKSIELSSGWRSKADISRRVGTWGMRGMATGGMVLEDVTDALRTERELGTEKLALHVKSVGLYGKHAAAKNAGFKKDDVIVALDGLADRMTEGQVLGYLLQKHFPGEKVKATVLRGQEKVELALPMQ
ncbi:MAG TPA: Trx7/PDZ domain-containing (seleno)protein [Candidatus Saccharimonadales bacterium]|nr:Trx7/PDZ domain-containing (seleno)protein [Candidatus Saccharimonadales bacterium]